MKALYYLLIISISFLIYSCAKPIESENIPYSSKYYYDMGLAGMSKENYAEAISNFIKSLKVNPNNEDSLIELAVAYEKVKNYNEAKKYLEKAINLDNKNYKAHIYLGKLYEDLKDYKSAKKEFMECIKDDECQLKPLAFYEIAKVYKEQNNIEKYIENLEQAVLYDNNFNKAKKDLIETYLYMNYCSSPQFYSKVIDLINSTSPKDFETEIYLIKCYTQAKDYNKAISLLKKVITSNSLTKNQLEKASNLLTQILIAQQVPTISTPNTYSSKNIHYNYYAANQNNVNTEYKEKESHKVKNQKVLPKIKEKNKNNQKAIAQETKKSEELSFDNVAEQKYLCPKGNIQLLETPNVNSKVKEYTMNTLKIYSIHKYNIKLSDGKILPIYWAHAEDEKKHIAGYLYISPFSINYYKAGPCG